MKEYLSYLFDFDLTLADSSKGIVKCFSIVLERHGYANVSENAIKRTIGKTLEESFTILTGITDSGKLAAMKAEYTSEADIHMNVNTVLFPETVAVLTTLKKSGAKIGIISTKYRYRIKSVVDQHFPKDFFDVIIGGEDVKAMKPDPYGVNKALHKLHCKKGDALYVGDSTVDAETAQNAGVDFCGVLNGMTTREELNAFPHRQILDNLSLLPLVRKRYPYRKSLIQLPTKAKAAMRLFKFKQIRGRKHYNDKNLSEHVCKNCGTTYTGNYCPVCSQKSSTQRFTMGNITRNFLEGLLNIDHGFSRNFFELFYRPGYMIRDYLDGKRAGYFKPFQTLFVLAALYVILAHVFSPESFVTETKQTQSQSFEAMADSMAKVRVAQWEAQQKRKGIPADTIELKKPEEEKKIENIHNLFGQGMEMFNAVKSRYYHEGTLLYSIIDLLKGWFEKNKAFSMLMFLPALVLCGKRSYRTTLVGQRLNLAEYIFVFVYFGSQIIWISILQLPFTQRANFDIFLDIGPSWAFLVWDMKQLFNLTWKESLRRTVLGMTLSGMLVNTIMIFVIWILLATAIAIKIAIT